MLKKTIQPENAFDAMSLLAEEETLIPWKDWLLKHALARYDNAARFDFSAQTSHSDPEKRRNEAGIRQILSRLQEELAPWRSRKVHELTEADLDRLEHLITAALLDLDRGRYLFEEPFLERFLEKGYLTSAREFLFMARDRDGTLNLAEIFQALRNVWIMNSLQLLWDLPLQVTPSVYAYSMLYPYTDNFLDDPLVPDLKKKRFNEKFTSVILGEPQTSQDPLEGRVFELFREIEGEYPRDGFPMVYEGLMMIQDAQILSLRQDQPHPLAPQILKELSFEKGGASVLADACLVKGTLSLFESVFAFCYGTFLQLADDLQDAEEDLREGHQTLFSRRDKGASADELIRALIAYITEVNRPAPDDPDNTRSMKKIIASASLMMIMAGIGKTPGLASPELYREIEAISKVRLTFYQKLGEELQSGAPPIDWETPICDLLKQ